MTYISKKYNIINIRRIIYYSEINNIVKNDKFIKMGISNSNRFMYISKYTNE